jgi:hypothetical protein
VQLAWWTVIILSAFIAILCKFCATPELEPNILLLLGIAGGTTLSAKLIDISDITNRRPRDIRKTGFMLDILSDNSGVSVHRLQAVVMNLAVGIWVVIEVWNNLHSGAKVNEVIPTITNQVMVLLAIGAGTYVTIKASENKP